MRGSNDIHNAPCSATVAKVIDLCDDWPFCPNVEKSERPLGRFERKMADRYNAHHTHAQNAYYSTCLRSAQTLGLKVLNLGLKLNLNQRTIQNNTITLSIHETVLDENYVAKPAPAMWL